MFEVSKSLIQQWMGDNRIFNVNAGTGTTPITFGAGSIDTTEPDVDFAVRPGTIFLPLKIHVQMETFGTTLLWEGMASVGAGATGARTGGTLIDPVSNRTSSPRNSALRGGSLASQGVASNVDASGATYQTLNVNEFWRFGANKVVDIATAIDTSTDVRTERTWLAVQEGFAPIVEAYDGTALGRLNVFSGSQAGTGFITVSYAEFRVDEFKYYFPEYVG